MRQILLAKVAAGLDLQNIQPVASIYPIEPPGHKVTAATFVEQGALAHVNPRLPGHQVYQPVLVTLDTIEFALTRAYQRREGSGLTRRLEAADTVV